LKKNSFSAIFISWWNDWLENHPSGFISKFEQPGLAGGVPAHGRGVGTRWSLRLLPTQPFYDSVVSMEHLCPLSSVGVHILALMAFLGCELSGRQDFCWCPVQKCCSWERQWGIASLAPDTLEIPLLLGTIRHCQKLDFYTLAFPGTTRQKNPLSFCERDEYVTWWSIF